ncbi:alpha-tocopherol transfer protein-like [Daktulosphaira vitifoliae]|uniref:alpha-tocopherol transfer protein-like n=1 Tax=Daktulosphaira vitifoliae TaxID=58002 RepID=UPI0021AA32BB|nr:alpha-tocopherol transfer protein-like [Daktulosphaira vitifoliae]
MLLTGIDYTPSIQIDNFTITLEIYDNLSPEIKKLAETELRETPENKKNGIDKLRQLLEQDKSLKTPLFNDAWLISFLRPTKFYPDSAYKLIKSYYQFKIKYSDMYRNLLPRNQKMVFDQNIITGFPKRDKKGCRIVAIELGKKWKHTVYSLNDLFKGMALFMDAVILEPTSQVAGIQVIIDMDDLSVKQAFHFTPSYAMMVLDWIQNSVPMRTKAIHIINQPFIFDIVYKMFKPFFKRKLQSRIFFHGTDFKSLHEHIPQSCLPERYNGSLELPELNGSKIYELLMTIEKEYEAINQYGYQMIRHSRY